MAAVQRGLPRDSHQRSVIEVGVGDARHQIGRARPQRRKAHARLSAEPAVHIRHERRGLFMPGDDNLDPRIQQGIGECQRFLSGHAKDETHALVFQTPHQQRRRIHASPHASTNL